MVLGGSEDHPFLTRSFNVIFLSGVRIGMYEGFKMRSSFALGSHRACDRRGFGCCWWRCIGR